MTVNNFSQIDANCIEIEKKYPEEGSESSTFEEKELLLQTLELIIHAENDFSENEDVIFDMLKKIAKELKFKIYTSKTITRAIALEVTKFSKEYQSLIINLQSEQERESIGAEITEGKAEMIPIGLKDSETSAKKEQETGQINMIELPSIIEASLGTEWGNYQSLKKIFIEKYTVYAQSLGEQETLQILNSIKQVKGKDGKDIKPTPFIFFPSKEQYITFIQDIFDSIPKKDQELIRGKHLSLQLSELMGGYKADKPIKSGEIRKPYTLTTRFLLREEQKKREKKQDLSGDPFILALKNQKLDSINKDTKTKIFELATTTLKQAKVDIKLIEKNKDTIIYNYLYLLRFLLDSESSFGKNIEHRPKEGQKKTSTYGPYQHITGIHRGGIIDVVNTSRYDGKNSSFHVALYNAAQSNAITEKFKNNYYKKLFFSPEDITGTEWSLILLGDTTEKSKSDIVLQDILVKVLLEGDAKAMEAFYGVYHHTKKTTTGVFKEAMSNVNKKVIPGKKVEDIDIYSDRKEVLLQKVRSDLESKDIVLVSATVQKILLIQGYPLEGITLSSTVNKYGPITQKGLTLFQEKQTPPIKEDIVQGLGLRTKVALLESFTTRVEETLNGKYLMNKQSFSLLEKIFSS